MANGYGTGGSPEPGHIPSWSCTELHPLQLAEHPVPSPRSRTSDSASSRSARVSAHLSPATRPRPSHRQWYVSSLIRSNHLQERKRESEWAKLWISQKSNSLVLNSKRLIHCNISNLNLCNRLQMIQLRETSLLIFLNYLYDELGVSRRPRLFKLFRIKIVWFITKLGL